MATIGPHCPVNLPVSDAPYMAYLFLSVDEDGHERGERINGYYQCPKCGLWWPNIETPDCWEQSDNGRWRATGWWGASVCEECSLLMVEQPDGTLECYSLGEPKEKHRCQHEGCTHEDAIDCYLPHYGDDADHDEPDYWYCSVHCHENGFCWYCGQFFAGIEAFDFAPDGLCSECRWEVRDQEDDYDDDWCDYDPDEDWQDEDY